VHHRSVHGSVQVEVFDADRRAFCVWSEQDAIEEALGCGNAGGGSLNVSYMLGEVATNGEADAFGCCLLWSYFGNDAQVGGHRPAGRGLWLINCMVSVPVVVCGRLPWRRLISLAVA
jgi:hypothetical protein